MFSLGKLVRFIWFSVDSLLLFSFGLVESGLVSRVWFGQVWSRTCLYPDGSRKSPSENMIVAKFARTYSLVII